MKLLFFLILFSLFSISSVLASTIGSFHQQNRIDIISQTGTDVNITWTFTEINNTHWLASFTLPPTSSVKNYPLITLTQNIAMSKPSIDQTKESSFYIIFPRGFKEGELAKFGSNSTIIGTSTTTPFYPYQRAICRDATDRIHMAWLMNTSAIVYANSTDGITWTTKFINASSSQKGTPHISCDGKNITIFYEDVGADDIYVYISTNNGGTFTMTNPVTSGVYGINGGVVGERRGQNIYVVWQTAISAVISVKFINSTDGGVTWGSQQTLFLGTYLPIVDFFTNFIKPSIIVNGTGTSSDRIFVIVETDGHDVDYTWDLTGKYSTDSGSSWTQIYPWSDVNSILGHSLGYDDNPEQLFISLGYGNDIYALNSSNLGSTWTTTIIRNNTGSISGKNPSVALDINQESCIFWQQNNATANRDNIVYLNRNNSVWNTSYTNYTTDFLQNQFPNTRWNYNAKGIDFVYINGTGTIKNITYDIVNCTKGYVPPVTTTTTTTSTTTSTTSTSSTTTTIQPTAIKTLFECERKICYENLKSTPKIIKIVECDLEDEYPYFLIFSDTKDLLWGIVCEN